MEAAFPELALGVYGGKGGSILHLRRRSRTIFHARKSLGQDEMFEELLDLDARAPNAENLANAENGKSFVRPMRKIRFRFPLQRDAAHLLVTSSDSA